MTDRQSFALANVTSDLARTNALRHYTKVIEQDLQRFGTILTVDFHPECLFWHACVSVINSKGMPVALDSLSSVNRTVIVELAKELLAAVGRSDSDCVHEERSSFHLIRRLTIEEEGLAKVAPGTAKVIVKRQAQPTSFR